MVSVRVRACVLVCLCVCAQICQVICLQGSFSDSAVCRTWLQPCLCILRVTYGLGSRQKNKTRDHLSRRAFMDTSHFCPLPSSGSCTTELNLGCWALSTTVICAILGLIFPFPLPHFLCKDKWGCNCQRGLARPMLVVIAPAHAQLFLHMLFDTY